MTFIFAFILTTFSYGVLAESRPDHYDELIDYVQEAPDQGEAATCLFMGNTGAMELLANKKAGIKNPPPFGPYDLAEGFSMWGPRSSEAKSFFDAPVLRFNAGYGIHASHWPFEAWTDGRVNYSVWDRHPKMNSLPRVELPKVETIKLFQYGNKWSTRVLNKSHVEMIKEALWKYQSPVLINYNDEGFWHVILIVGYDDRLPGTCYGTDPKECESDIGSFYVRDSFGVRVELRDYDWFRVKGNAAFVVKLK
jgi:hypothetical protein